MSDTSSRLLRALRDLGIALINATLILVVIALLLGLKLSNQVDRITSDFARNLVSAEPLRNDVQAMTGELSALRSDLAGIREQSGELTSETAQALTARLEIFEARLDKVSERMETVRDRVQSIELDPKAMFDRAVETAANQVVVSAGQLAGCEMPGALEPLTAPRDGAQTN